MPFSWILFKMILLCCKNIIFIDSKGGDFMSSENLLKTSPTYKKMVYLQELEKEVEGR